MSKNYDVMVLGLGANGSSALYHLSQTGSNVCGIDQYQPPHPYGSSHGQSRIIRQAYHESPLYVPLVTEAYNLWYDIEKKSGKKLFLRTGGLMLGNENSKVIRGARLSAETHNIPYEYLDGKTINKRFPVLKSSADTVGVLEKNAGILFPEACIQTCLDEAQKTGATLYYNERVIRITPNNNTIEITTDKSIYIVSKLIISAGAWLTELVPELKLPLSVERQVLYWFKNTKQELQPYLTPDKLPIYIWEYLPGKTLYGFPDLGDGIKIAFHHEGLPALPNSLSKTVSQEELQHITEVAEQLFNLELKFNYATTCMYTNTPDEDFIIDFHPQHSNIILASPCSGHGFKFASLTGKLLCNMAIESTISFDLSPFRLARFNN